MFQALSCMGGSRARGQAEMLQCFVLIGLVSCNAAQSPPDATKRWSINSGGNMSCKDEQHLSPICTVKRLMQAHYGPDTNAQEQEPTAGPSAESTLRADLLHLLSIPQKLQLPPLKGYATSHELASSDARKLFDLATPGPSQLTSSKAVSDWLVRLKNGVEQLLAGQENSLKALARGIKRKGTTVHDNEASKRHNWPGSDVVDGGLSYPLLRRVIISALLKADMERAAQGAPVWDQSTQHAAMDLAIQLYRLHVSGMAARGILEYLHVSKAGGSSMCFAGAGNGCRTYDASLMHTCLMPEFHDRPHWIRPDVHHAMLTQSLGTHPTPSNSTHRGSRTLDMQFVFVAVGILRSVGIHPDGDQPASSCSARAAQLRNHGLNFHANEYTLLTRGVNETALLEPGGLWYRDDKYTADILRGSSMNPEERQKMWLGMKRGQNGSASESMIEDSGTREHGSDADAETGDEGAGIDGDDEKKRHLRMLRSRLLYAHNKSGAKSVARSDSGTNVNIGGRHTASAGSAITSSSRASGAICAEQAGVGAEGCVQLCRETASVLILRHPWTRLASHIAYIVDVYRKRLSGAIVRAALTGRNAAFWSALAPPLVDNYLTRSLSGEAVMNAEAGRVTRTHMQVAAAMLSQVDVVHVLEAQPQAVNATFHYGLGWRHTLLQEHARMHGTPSASTSPSAHTSRTNNHPSTSSIGIIDGSSSSSSSSSSGAPSAHAGSGRRLLENTKPSSKRGNAIEPADFLPHDLQTLRPLNRLDVELYRFGALLSSLDLMVWNAAHAAGMAPYPGFAPHTTPGETLHLPRFADNFRLPAWTYEGQPCGHVGARVPHSAWKMQRLRWPHRSIKSKLKTMK